MRRIVVVGLLLLTGCCGLVGPRQRLCQPGRVDDPRLPIGEQERLGRDRLALPEQSADLAPRTFAEQPGYHDRQH